MTMILDAQQAYGFLVPQVYRINTAIEQASYPSFDYASLIPVNEDGDMWDIGTVFYSGDIAGQAEFISGKGFDMPYADTSVAQHVQGLELMGIGYEYSLAEINRASKAGRNLPTDKADAARRVAEMACYNISLTGSHRPGVASEKGWTGLLNNPDVPTVAATTGGWGAATDADLILADINQAISAVATNTGETHHANTVLLPSAEVRNLASKRVGDSGDTVLKFIRDNNAFTSDTGQPLTIRGLRNLTDKIVAYDKTPGVMQFHLPGAHMFLPVYQKSGMSFEVPGLFNTGGTEIRRPKAVAYVTL